MTPEPKRIYHLLEQAFSAHPWHGAPVMSFLKDLSASKAFHRPIPNGHTIWEIVLHLISWRNFACKKLQGEETFDITSPEEDWPAITDSSASAWQYALQDLYKSQEQLLAAIQATTDEKLEEMVPGRTYSYYVLLHGIIGHDLYHTGQIALLAKF